MSTAGGTDITITGNNFETPQVFINNAAANVKSFTANQIVVTAPPQPGVIGDVSVVVRNRSGLAATAEAQTAYCAHITCTPTNPEGSAPGALNDFRPPPELLYRADWHVTNDALAGWDERFKKEIQNQ